MNSCRNYTLINPPDSVLKPFNLHTYILVDFHQSVKGHRDQPYKPVADNNEAMKESLNRADKWFQNGPQKVPILLIMYRSGAVTQPRCI